MIVALYKVSRVLLCKLIPFEPTPLFKGCEDWTARMFTKHSFD